jgi:cell wall-associated NlpC family hydrolase
MAHIEFSAVRRRAAAAATWVTAAATLASGAALVGLGAAATSPVPTGRSPVSRLAGPDRYATAAAISAATFSPGVPAVYLATGLDFPDALAGAAAAGGRGPVLLASDSGLSAVTSAELHRLAPGHVVVLGGTSSVSAATATAASAAAGAAVSRLAGPDRYATAAAISAATFSPGVPAVYLATGLDFPDALAGAAAAGGRGPILLVTADTLPNAAAGELRRLAADSTTVLGGLASVGATVGQMADAMSAQGVPAPSPAAALAVAAAQAQLGKPYLWAGGGPDAFDCSGLTAWAWAAAGALLPHNAQAQDDLIASIPVSAVVPGDLVFFGSPVGHVGIVVGPGQMIEAAHTGTLVRVATFLDRGDLAGAGRPLPSTLPHTSVPPSTPATTSTTTA